MAKINRGRLTANIEGPFVVFAIGLRINRVWQFWRWMPVVAAMGPMIRQLRAHPDKGLLGFESFFSGRTTLMLQYWQSFAQLEAFARNPDDPHLSNWRAFNRRVGNNGSVGIYHETYIVQAGAHETMYVNMPAFGLGAATELVPARGRRETARRRLGFGENEPGVPTTDEPGKAD